MHRIFFKPALSIIVFVVFVSSLNSCGKGEEDKPTSIDFTIDVSSGVLTANGGSIVMNGVLIARTNNGDFIAVTSVCTNEATHETLNYNAANNNFVCPIHNEQYSSLGIILMGSGTKNLTKYNTSLTGTTLRVYS